MAPLSLFSPQTPTVEKRALATSLLALKPNEPCRVPADRFGTGFGKPRFPDIDLNTTLADLVGRDSWFFFASFVIDPTFLVDGVDSWLDDPVYIAAAQHVRAVNVVNDCAERGVKLSSDYIEAARGEMHYQKILQVVEHDRVEQPNLRSCTLHSNK